MVHDLQILLLDSQLKRWIIKRRTRVIVRVNLGTTHYPTGDPSAEQRDHLIPCSLTTSLESILGPGTSDTGIPSESQDVDPRSKGRQSSGLYMLLDLRNKNNIVVDTT